MVDILRSFVEAETSIEIVFWAQPAKYYSKLIICSKVEEVTLLLANQRWYICVSWILMDKIRSPVFFHPLLQQERESILSTENDLQGIHWYQSSIYFWFHLTKASTVPCLLCPLSYILGIARSTSRVSLWLLYLWNEQLVDLGCAVKNVDKTHWGLG